MRAYLDHNATTPLRAEARAAMAEAMDLAGNPSSVHAEGRAAKGLMEKARAEVAGLVGCGVNQVIFTSGATEAAALAVAQRRRHGGLFAALPTEHDCLLSWADETLPSLQDRAGRMRPEAGSALLGWLTGLPANGPGDRALLALSAANSETGVLWEEGIVPGRGVFDSLRAGLGSYGVVSDITQMAGKMPIRFGAEMPSYMILSAHKLGGPRGIGALINLTPEDPLPILTGGGQEMGRRSGTENIIGIAGFGAAARAAAQDVAEGRWDRVAEIRNILESALEAATKKTIFVGNESARLPNTSCILTPGWKGETQVMQMDLAGFAISAGSACSSGKVRASTVLRAMGYDENEAASAIRVSLGLETEEEDVLRFADAWTAKLKKYEERAA